MQPPGWGLLQPNSLDCIVSFETLEHLPPGSDFLGVLHSLLKPGGTLVASAPFGKGIRGAEEGEVCGHFHHFEPTEEEFEGEVMRGLGFSV
mmetsp:Transcript_18119/g.58607  ORF Transcript_18119/g.58607 Transcript_18119/m.58607 type:complete len:91 (-) Transcript_18119:36-308(-)